MAYESVRGDCLENREKPDGAAYDQANQASERAKDLGLPRACSEWSVPSSSLADRQSHSRSRGFFARAVPRALKKPIGSCSSLVNPTSLPSACSE